DRFDTKKHGKSLRLAIFEFSLRAARRRATGNTPLTGAVAYHRHTSAFRARIAGIAHLLGLLVVTFITIAACLSLGMGPALPITGFGRCRLGLRLLSCSRSDALCPPARFFRLFGGMHRSHNTIYCRHVREILATEISNGHFTVYMINPGGCHLHVRAAADRSPRLKFSEGKGIHNLLA